ncbi:hypothetical protein [Frigoriglobus tundricola]|uniref:Lipoprotein n=1 Tax=Frigoriglobus tundricola TaxID=2774151 RepID=A0A6M5YRH2_9BACT|nr:hypothetical protein [Frigoriglobus tundricola]QJW96578.1 hypothetical protein FTUN_4135 [Frigoriglobus tundricola]
MHQAYSSILFLLGVMALSGCGKKSTETVGPPNSGENAPGPSGSSPKESPAGRSAFLDKTKQVPPRLEWNTDITSNKGGEVTFRVSCAAPVGITVVTDKGYKAVTGKGKINKSDVLLTVDAKPPSYEGRVVVPAGTSWFIIENQSGAAASIRLECFAK